MQCNCGAEATCDFIDVIGPIVRKRDGLADCVKVVRRIHCFACGRYEQEPRGITKIILPPLEQKLPAWDYFSWH